MRNQDVRKAATNALARIKTHTPSGTEKNEQKKPFREESP